MRILLVDGEAGLGRETACEFESRGHDVVECFRDEDQLCVGATDSAMCPVDSLGCDVAVVVGHDGPSPRLREMGAICATRRHLPLVDSATVSGGLVDAVEALDVGSRPGLVDVVEQRLRGVPAVIRIGRVPTVAVRHVGGRLVMTLDLPQGLTRQEEESVVTWAVRALRESDPHTLSADIIVHGRNRG